ncbi:type IV pilus biogenesis/stability protein PilW [Vibrio sp. S17_S38]|uniref:type IV pilus biogenesis/stability protein PilW n=1 Tax=Vibrio sp. S17_S38 TaxID=2720229 RepID=UPI0016807252|nr:type IV pilus biogenesis/stability protein PilW [Vibrio sp. S17_S38]MBD1573610.1 type IV pilus biogenesis/stability protein PilW [Vibrio sp. S17_S38]
MLLIKKLGFISVVSFLAGCVTVTDNPNMAAFDSIKASEGRISLGLGYLKDNHMVKARENLEMAVKYAPTYYRALNSVAYYYQRVGEDELAKQAYEKALKSSPKNGDVLNNYGAFLCRQGEYKKADEYFNLAIEQPYYYLVAASYENAGLCALKSGDKEQASHYFSRALAHDPDRAKSAIHLAELEIQEGELSDARLRLFKFNKRYGYLPVSLELLIQLEKQAANPELVSKYGNILKTKYPNSIQYQKYKKNEY